jgi:oligopeptidase B
LRNNAEAGDPNKEADFNAMLAYAPYYNVKAQAYPHMLITSSRLDPRVDFHDPVKFTARLRSLNTGDRDILLRVNMEGGGHMGAPGREDRLRETAFEYAFLLRALDVGK